MISKIRFIQDENTFIEYYLDGERQTISNGDITKVWPSIESSEEFEFSRAYIWDNSIAFLAEVAEGQGGCLFVWEPVKREFIHYSDCAYATDVIKHGDDLILIKEISNYVTPYHIEVFVVPFGTRDILDEGKRVYCDKPQGYESKNEYGDVRLEEEEGMLFVVTSAGRYLYSSNVNKLRDQKPNAEFAELYIVWDNQMHPGKSVIRGMIT